MKSEEIHCAEIIRRKKNRKNYFTTSIGKKLLLIISFLFMKKRLQIKEKFLHQKFSSEKTFLSKSDAGAALQTTFSMYDSFS